MFLWKNIFLVLSTSCWTVFIKFQIILNMLCSNSKIVEYYFVVFFFELNWNRRLQSGSNSKKIDKVKLLTYWCTKLPRLSTLAVKNGLYSFYFFYYLCVNPRSVQTNLNKQELSVRIEYLVLLFFFSIFIFCFT